ncbi:hypothetical protein BH11PSE12_BH11PSE12_25250 [soil metagenome]
MGGETTQIVGMGDLARYRTSRFSAYKDSRPDRSAVFDAANEVGAKFIERL